MLTTDMTEGNSRVIELPESSEVLRNLFELIYKRECSSQNLKALQGLVVATQKYLLLDLHKTCVDVMTSMLDCGKEVKLLIFAHENGLEYLKKKTVEKIVR